MDVKSKELLFFFKIKFLLPVLIIEQLYKLCSIKAKK